MLVSFDQLKEQLKGILLKFGFSETRAELCATIFSQNSRDGVYSHGINRFPVFIQYVKEGIVDKEAEPEKIGSRGAIEYWDGHLAPGMYTATLAMQEAIRLAKKNGMGCVSVKNTNHWMRGGTYGWLAAEAGCVGICSSNTIANMPPWGGLEPRLGNNPLVIAVPQKNGHIVLDMALSQFSYGKLQEYELKSQQLPVAGGYDQAGEFTRDPASVLATKRPLPIGFWKGSSLSFVLDVLVASLSGGRSVGKISATGKESGLSQIFICLDASGLDDSIAEEIILFTKSSRPIDGKTRIFYPGENVLATRIKNDLEGIPVHADIWKQVQQL